MGEKIVNGLYKSLVDIIKPSISRRNISSYKIILSDVLIPIRVYYPRVSTELNKIIICKIDSTSTYYESLAVNNNGIVIKLEDSVEDSKILVDYIRNHIDQLGLSLDRFYIFDGEAGLISI